MRGEGAAAASSSDDGGEWTTVPIRRRAKATAAAAATASPQGRALPSHGMRPSAQSRTTPAREHRPRRDVSLGRTDHPSRKLDSDKLFKNSDDILKKYKPALLSPPTDPVPEEVSQLGPFIKTRLTRIKDLVRALTGLTQGERDYIAPIGPDTARVLKACVDDIYEAMTTARDRGGLYIGLIVDCCKIVRNLEKLRLYDVTFFTELAECMVAFNKVKNRKTPLFPFTVINFFFSMSKVMCVPQCIEFHELIDEKITTLEEEMKPRGPQAHPRTDLNQWGTTPNDLPEFTPQKLLFQDLLACVVIGYHMMPTEEREAIEGRLRERQPSSPRLRALDLLQRLPQTITPENGNLFVPKILQMFYWSLLLEGTAVNERYRPYVESFFREARPPISSGTERKLRESMERAVVGSGRFFEVYEALKQDNVQKLYTEIDFILKRKKDEATAASTREDPEDLIFFESDGPFHFVRRNDSEARERDTLNGQTCLKTKLLLTRGKVVRMSSLCETTPAYDKRIQEMPQVVHRVASENVRCALVDPENYPVNFIKSITPYIYREEEFPSLAQSFAQADRVPVSDSGQIRRVPYK